MISTLDPNIHVFDGLDATIVSRALARASYEGLAILHDGQIVACNSQFHTLCAIDGDTPSVESCFGAGAIHDVMQVLDDAASEGKKVAHIRHDSGWLEVRSRRMAPDDLPLEFGVLVVRDITAEVHATQALERAKADLEQFAYVASHDLKSPLRGIANLASWIREDLDKELDGRLVEYFDLLEGRVHRMETLLEDLLAFSRAGRTRASIAKIVIDDFIEDVVDLLAPPEGFEVDVNAPSVTVQVTPTPLRTVIQNLVQNACKHHDRDQGTIEVAAAVDNEAMELIVEITDDGPGIPDQFHEKVFQVFETLRPRDEIEGSGIGLALVKRLVDHAGGVIELESPVEADRGTRFRMSWPLIEVSPIKDETNSA